MIKKALTFFLCVSCLFVEQAHAVQQTNRRVIVFDFGGVIAHADTVQMSEFLLQTFSINRDELSQVLRNMQSFVAKGGSERQFWHQYALSQDTLLPIDWFEQYGAVIKKSIIEIPETLAIVEALQRQGYQTPMLSDVTQYQAEIIRELGYYDLFKPVLLSYETGVKKPNPEAFTILLKTTQAPPSVVIFIDDRIENVRAAKDQGIDGILFINPTQLKEELARRGIHYSRL